MITEIALITFSVVVGLILAYPFAYRAGKAKGEALGWQDGYFKRIADDREHAAKKLRNFEGRAK